MVGIVEVAEEVGNLADLESNLREAVTQPRSEPPKPAAEAAKAPQVKLEEVKLDGEHVPAKLRGKTLADLVDSYKNLESAYGRMANDLGTQRQLTDRLLELKRDADLQQNGAGKKPAVERTELLENPTDALDKYLTERERTRDSEAQQRLARVEAALAAKAFQDKHPDFQSFVGNEEFVQWIGASPLRVRAAQAAQAGDFTAADELLTDYKASRASAAPKQEQPKVDESKNVEAARAAALESGSGGSKAPTGGGKTYRRADLIRLRLEKPDTYYSEDFQSEILKAYAEGRVK